MRLPIRELLLGAALLCAVSAPGDAQAQAPTPEGPTTLRLTVPNFVPVTDAMLRAPKSEDWLLYRGNYQGWGYSPLEQINKTNVKNLQLVWSRKSPGCTSFILNEPFEEISDVVISEKPSDTGGAIKARIRSAPGSEEKAPPPSTEIRPGMEKLWLNATTRLSTSVFEISTTTS